MSVLLQCKGLSVFFEVFKFFHHHRFCALGRSIQAYHDLVVPCPCRLDFWIASPAISAFFFVRCSFTYTPVPASFLPCFNYSILLFRLAKQIMITGFDLPSLRGSVWQAEMPLLAMNIFGGSCHPGICLVLCFQSSNDQVFHARILFQVFHPFLQVVDFHLFFLNDFEVLHLVHQFNEFGLLLGDFS